MLYFDASTEHNGGRYPVAKGQDNLFLRLHLYVQWKNLAEDEDIEKTHITKVRKHILHFSGIKIHACCAGMPKPNRVLH